MRNHFLRAATDAGPAVSNAWDLNYAEFTGTPVNFKYINDQEPLGRAVFFKSDGTAMYIVGSSNDTVYQYTLTVAWDVSTASYSSKSFSVASQDSTPTGLSFGNNGYKMYIVGAANDTVYEYDLSPAWDVSTASYNNKSFSVASQETNPEGIYFRDDGTADAGKHMYITGLSSTNVLHYTLSTAWDVSTASYNQAYSVSTQTSRPMCVQFGDSGSKMYVADDSNNQIRQYNLTVNWDISSAGYAAGYSVDSLENVPGGIFLKPDGKTVWLVGYTNDAVWELNLSTDWLISSASFTYPSTDYINISAKETLASGVFFKPDGTKMYVMGFSGDDINEYTLSPAWEVGSASFVTRVSIQSQDTTPIGLFFSDDGKKMYHCGWTNDSVYEYSLNPGWDLSSLSYDRSLSVSSYETQPMGVYIGDNGSKLYISGQTSDAITRFDLSIAWNLSSASFAQTQSLGGNIRGMSFKPDGKRMYAYNSTTSGGRQIGVEQYNLSADWDITTASLDTTFNILPLETSLYGLTFKPDGTKLFTIGPLSDAVVGFTIS